MTKTEEEIRDIADDHYRRGIITGSVLSAIIYIGMDIIIRHLW